MQIVTLMFIAYAIIGIYVFIAMILDRYHPYKAGKNCARAGITPELASALKHDWPYPKLFKLGYKSR